MPKTSKSLSALLSLALLAVAAGTSPLAAPDAAYAQDVGLSAKKAPGKGKKAAAKAKGKGNASAGRAAPLPVNGTFPPLFTSPSAPPAWMAGDFVGRDENLTGEMNFTAQAAAARAAQIRQTESDFRLQKPGSPQALQVGTNLIRLYEEQCLYLENVRGLGMQDKTYADINHFTKTTRSKLVAVIDQVLRQFPNSEMRARWKATQLISRVKIGDPTAPRDALAFTRQVKGDEGRRVIIVGVAWDAMAGRTKSAFGSVDGVLDLEIDAQSRAAFKLFKAEALAKSNPRAAIAAYEDAAKEGGAIRRPDGAMGPVSQRAAAKLIELSLSQRADAVDPDLVATLQGLGLVDAARYYAEQVALRSVNK